MYRNDVDSDDSEGGQTVTETMEDVFKANMFICDLNFVMKSSLKDKIIICTKQTKILKKHVWVITIM